MNEEIKNENVDTEEVSTTLTDDQVHHIYNELSDVDKESGEKLANAENETKNVDYTTEDNNIIKSEEAIPGINAEGDITDSIKVTDDVMKEVLNPYNLDTDSTIKMLNLINEYKAGNKSNLYNRLPDSFKVLVNNLVASEIKNASYKQAVSMKNAGAAMIIDSFINDAKISTAVDDFSSELQSTVAEMNTEYDDIVTKAMEETFSKIEEIRAKDPAQAERIELIKKAFDSAIVFERQLTYAEKATSYEFTKCVEDYKGHVIRFNTKVNNNTFGVKIPDIEEIVPIIRAGLPETYNMTDIKKFIICICKTSGDYKNLADIAYNYRMISNILKYKYMTIDEKGKTIFENISKVIDAIKSRRK